MDKARENDYTDAEITTIAESADNYAIKITNSEAAVSSISYSLNLDSSTAVNLYFSSDVTPTAVVDGKTADVSRDSANSYSLAINDIPAHELGKSHSVIITADGKTCTINVSALSYVKTVLSSEELKKDTELKNACAAIYKYYEAMTAYREAHKEDYE